MNSFSFENKKQTAPDHNSASAKPLQEQAACDQSGDRKEELPAWHLQGDQLTSIFDEIFAKDSASIQQELSAAHLEEAQLQELQLSKPLGEQQQKKELEKKEQLVDYKIMAENQLENDNFEQRVPDRQLQQNLLQVQNQLQISNQEQILLQQPSFENSFGNQKPFAENKQSFEEELAFQSSSFGSLVFQKNFSASKGLAEKNFLNKQFFQNSLGRTAAGACKEQLPATCFTGAIGNEQAFRAACCSRGSQKKLPTNNL